MIRTYRPWLLVALVVVAVAHRRLAPSSSATTSTTERALLSSAVQVRCWSRPTTYDPAVLVRTERSVQVQAKFISEPPFQYWER